MNRIFRHLTLFTALLTIAFSGIAQTVAIRGQVKNDISREPMEFVNVVLQTADSAFVAGTVTEGNGRFTMDKIATGSYRIVLSSVGYETQYIELENLNRSVQLDDITMSEAALSLEGVTVTGSATSSRIDRKLIVPSALQLQTATNGIDLLQRLMLPRVSVNPMSSEVSIPGGGELQLRINGVKVEKEDILALLPADIIRIEYHDNPGLRYGNAEIVLDYIVRRPETGGDIGLNLRDAPFVAWGDNRLNARINHKKSEFAVNYSISHRDFYQVWRDNAETFHFADGSTLNRIEKGEPGHGQLYWQNLNAKYNYQDDSKMFNATFRLYTSNGPHFFDYHGILQNTADATDRIDMIDLNSNIENRPALDLYYQHSLPNDQTLVFNAVGTYNATVIDRQYRESRDGIMLTDIDNHVEGNKYSVIGEGIYEKKLGDRRLSAGIRHTQSWSDNTYINGHDYRTEMGQMQTFIYAEFKGKLSKLDYSIGAGATREYLEQKGEAGYQNYTFNPRITLFYPISDASSIRLRSEISNASPSLSNLSAIEQAIDSLQIQRGNPNLDPYLRYRTQLNYEYRKGIFAGSLNLQHEYHPRAVMEEKFLEGNKIVQTWNNQRSWQFLQGGATMRLGPVKDMFQLTWTTYVNHYISHGNDYLHHYTNWYNELEGMFTYKHVFVVLGLESNWDRFYGETMSGGENIHYAMVGYKYKNMSCYVGMFNPFVDNYHQDTENWSRYASFRRSNYINESSRAILLNFTWNFSFGRKFNSSDKRLNNADDDSGVMKSGK